MADRRDRQPMRERNIQENNQESRRRRLDKYCTVISLTLIQYTQDEVNKGCGKSSHAL
jgi:hypothetical protein